MDIVFDRELLLHKAGSIPVGVICDTKLQAETYIGWLNHHCMTDIMGKPFTIDDGETYPLTVFATCGTYNHQMESTDTVTVINFKDVAKLVVEDCMKPMSPAIYCGSNKFELGETVELCSHGQISYTGELVGVVSDTHPSGALRSRPYLVRTANEMINCYDNISKVKTKLKMSRLEMMKWARSDESIGWVVCKTMPKCIGPKDIITGVHQYQPTSASFSSDRTWWRAKINDDDTIGEWECMNDNRTR